MSLSHSDIPCPRTRAIGVCIFVLLTHIGLLLAISTTTTTAYVPSLGINTLESFVIEHPATQRVSSSDETTSSAEIAGQQGKHTPPNEEAVPVLQETHTEKISPQPDQPKPNSPYNSPTISSTISQANSHAKNTAKTQTVKNSHQPAITSKRSSNDITLPVTHAAYLNNPHPAYPRQSKRLGEQGTVLLLVEIDVDGSASQVKIQQSSGHPRLDRAALEAVAKWRFIAGKKAGVPQKMWVNIPIHFVLE